jgi:hypothetical protein
VRTQEAALKAKGGRGSLVGEWGEVAIKCKRNMMLLNTITLFALMTTLVGL